MKKYMAIRHWKVILNFKIKQKHQQARCKFTWNINLNKLVWKKFMLVQWPRRSISHPKRLKYNGTNQSSNGRNTSSALKKQNLTSTVNSGIWTHVVWMWKKTLLMWDSVLQCYVKRNVSLQMGKQIRDRREN